MSELIATLLNVVAMLTKALTDVGVKPDEIQKRIDLEMNRIDTREKTDSEEEKKIFTDEPK